MNTHREQAQITVLRGGDEFARMIRVAIDDGDTAFADKALEQAELRLQVIGEARMIIQMIARDVGEGGRGNLDAVEPELVEPVARGFEREMLDALVLQSGELGMQRDRIRRRVRKLHVAGGGIDAERAEARCLASLR